MKYNININQLALSKYKKLDLKDAAILYYIIDWCSSSNKNIEKIKLEDGEYTWINYKHLILEMPILKINQVVSLSQRIKKLKESGLIKATQQNTSKGWKLYIRLTDEIEKLYFREEDSPLKENLEPIKSTLKSPLKENLIEHNTIEHNTNNIQIQSIYDLFIKEFKKNPNQCKLSEVRKNKIKARLNDAGEEMLIKAIKNTAQAPFYRGDNDSGWKATLDFIIRSYEKVEELANMEAKKVKELTQDEYYQEQRKQQNPF
jgi:hypothetical protein